jgi:hypothetical protein
VRQRLADWCYRLGDWLAGPPTDAVLDQDMADLKAMIARLRQQYQPTYREKQAAWICEAYDRPVFHVNGRMSTQTAFVVEEHAREARLS